MADLKTSLQIPEEFLARADRVAARLSKVAEYQALGKMTRSKALRLAIARGLALLESEYGKARRKR